MVNKAFKNAAMQAQEDAHQIDATASGQMLNATAVAMLVFAVTTKLQSNSNLILVR